jgi:acyl-CoA synthetase (AMP-forming)/AMP-acid ligase II
VDPEDLWSLGADLPYAVRLSWARSAPDGSFDAALVRLDAAAADPAVDFPAEPAPSGRHTNSLWHAVAENLDPADVRDFLREKLPGQAMPTRFVLLEDLPLTPDGEVDKTALASIQWA